MPVVGSIPMHFRQAPRDSGLPVPCPVPNMVQGLFYAILSSWPKQDAPANLSIKIKKEKKMLGGIGLPELIVILVIVLVIFGAGKLPQIGEGLGKGIRNFKKATKDKEEIDVTPKKPEEISEKK